MAAGVVEDQAEVGPDPHGGHLPGRLEEGVPVQAVHGHQRDGVDDQDEVLYQDEYLVHDLR